MSSLLNVPEAQTFRHEYSSLACTVVLVEDVYAAIDHIHRHGRYIVVFSSKPVVCACEWVCLCVGIHYTVCGF